MTFFANSGVAWPNLEEITSQAGSKSLEAASDLFSIIAKIEGGGVKPLESQSKVIEAAAQKFSDAAILYESVIDQISGTFWEQPSTAEFELAHIPNYRSRYGEDYLDLRSARQAYIDIAFRLKSLAASVTDIRFEKERVDLAPLIFRLMGDWERLASIARLIAVVNRRNPDRY